VAICTERKLLFTASPTQAVRAWSLLVRRSARHIGSDWLTDRAERRAGWRIRWPHRLGLWRDRARRRTLLVFARSNDSILEHRGRRPTNTQPSWVGGWLADLLLSRSDVRVHAGLRDRDQQPQHQEVLRCRWRAVRHLRRLCTAAVQHAGTRLSFPSLFALRFPFIRVVPNISCWQTGKVIRVLEGHTRAIRCMVLFKSQRELFTASGDGTIRRWNFKKGLELAVYKCHTEGVTSITIDEQRRLLYSAGQDGTLNHHDLSIRLWRLELSFIHPMGAQEWSACGICPRRATGQTSSSRRRMVSSCSTSAASTTSSRETLVPSMPTTR